MKSVRYKPRRKAGVVPNHIRKRRASRAELIRPGMTMLAVRVMLREFRRFGWRKQA